MPGKPTKKARSQLSSIQSAQGSDFVCHKLGWYVSNAITAI